MGFGIELGLNFSSWSLSESVLTGELGVPGLSSHLGVLTGNRKGTTEGMWPNTAQHCKGAEGNFRIPESQTGLG